MPMGSEQNDPTNLLGLEPWLQATRRGGGVLLSLRSRPFCSWPPRALGNLQTTGQCSQLIVTRS